MKIFAFIFVLYLLALSLIPCGDAGGGIVHVFNHLLGAEHQEPTGHDHHSNTCDDDFCSPFCMCSCCQITSERPTELAMPSVPLTPVPDKYSLYMPDFQGQLFVYTIWEPPKG